VVGGLTAGAPSRGLRGIILPFLLHLLVPFLKVDANHPAAIYICAKAHFLEPSATPARLIQVFCYSTAIK